VLDDRSTARTTNVLMNVFTTHETVAYTMIMLYGHGALLLAVLFACSSTVKGSHKVELTVKSVRAIQGKVSTQNVSVLSVLDQHGTQNSWNKYMEIDAGTKTRFVADFKLSYSGNVAHLKNLSVAINSIGLPATMQKRALKIQTSSGAWKTVATNQNSQTWIWYSQVALLPSASNTYFAKDGSLTIRVVSSNSMDVMDLDYMVIEASVNDDTSSPITPTSAPTVANPPSGSTHAWWTPKASDALTWQWQLNGVVNTSVNVNVYDIDLFDTTKQEIKFLKDQGRTVICYFSAGTYEGWRSDWKTFFSFVVNDSYNGSKPPFAGKMADWNERWLDIRRMDLLTPIMTSRLELAAANGCDGVEPDNVDAYSNAQETRLNITASDQLAYNRWLATKAHELGLAVGLKNDVEQTTELVNDFDFAINEQCFQHNECAAYKSFTNQDKAVFGVEYVGDPSIFCPKAKALHLSWMFKKLSLMAYRIGCEGYT
jgi:hypothetical protein